MRILTFDIEEWFHLLDNPASKTEDQWKNFDSRIRLEMDLIFDILEKTEKSATFFIVGWMAETHPEIIREISDYGFEIGSHTHLHQLVYEQDRKTFYDDVKKSITIIEDCIGKKVKSFRAPGFSITKKNLWAFEVLHELGITKDSSIFPAIRAHGGLPSYNFSTPSILEYNGIQLKEFPINMYSILGKPFSFSGGGYFRLLPYELIKSFTKRSNYVMSYFHPRDFDYDQPLVPGLSTLRKFKSYVGLKNCKKKLERWLNDFDFVDLNQVDQSINWNDAPKINL